MTPENPLPTNIAVPMKTVRDRMAEIDFGRPPTAPSTPPADSSLVSDALMTYETAARDVLGRQTGHDIATAEVKLTHGANTLLTTQLWGDDRLSGPAHSFGPTSGLFGRKPPEGAGSQGLWIHRTLGTAPVLDAPPTPDEVTDIGKRFGRAVDRADHLKASNLTFKPKNSI